MFRELEAGRIVNRSGVKINSFLSTALLFLWVGVVGCSNPFIPNEDFSVHHTPAATETPVLSPSPTATVSPSPSPLAVSSPTPTPPGYSANLSWAGSKESAVNKSGGGYRIYYSQNPGFDLASASIKNVPYVSGATAPTSTTVSGLAAGTYYFRVVAYSSLISVDNVASRSAPSAEVSITLP